jgi:hypothetical protein
VGFNNDRKATRAQKWFLYISRLYAQISHTLTSLLLLLLSNQQQFIAVIVVVVVVVRSGD